MKAFEAAIADFKIRSNPILDDSKITLVATVKNETTFIPAFLEHYRALGVERFVMLDDRSTDGTFELLQQQRDVMVIGSDHVFNTTVTFEDPEARRMLGRDTVSMHVMWKQLMLARYCTDRWAVLVDLDEFIVLPPGYDLRRLFAELDASEPCDAVAAAMIDCYPASVTEMAADTGPFRLDGRWLFDGVPHVRVDSAGKVRCQYEGSRSRLSHQYMAASRFTVRQALRDGLRMIRSALRQHRPMFPLVSEIVKEPVLRWREDAWLPSSHRTSLRKSRRHVLPIAHFKFVGDLHRRVAYAIAHGNHYRGSQEYKEMSALLDAMKRTGGAFAMPSSLQACDAEHFRSAGCLMGFGGEPTRLRQMYLRWRVALHVLRHNLRRRRSA